MRAALLLVACAGLTAQDLTRLDLSGEWRKSADDQAIYASPGFDDRNWATVRLPWPDALPIPGVFWLRRSVDLPPGVDRARLVLTLGPVREVYEVYVNGLRIAETGPFFDDRKAQVARTRTFPVPAQTLGEGTRISIALRTRRVYFGSLSTAVFTGGSYLLSVPELAPVTEGRAMLNAHKLQFAPQALFSILLLSLALLTLILWLSERSNLGLFWLFVVLASRGIVDWLLYSRLSLDGFPRDGVSWAGWFQAANVAAVAELVVATFGLRPGRFRALFWCASIGCSLIQQLGTGALIAQSLAFAMLANRWRARSAQSYGWAGQAALVTLVLLSFMQVQGLSSGLPRFGSWTTWWGVGEYRFSSQSTLVFVLGGLLMLLALRRLIVDRVEKQRLSGELEAARVVQQLLLDSGKVAPGAWTAEAEYLPAQEVGGDFYLFVDHPSGSLIVVAGDVSGKGLRAAMLVSVAIGILRNEKTSSPAAILGALNNGLHGHCGGGFVTCCCARFDADGAVMLANAGHPPPCCDGREVEVPASLPLGVMPGLAYEESVVRGERFTFVSDGVVEAENAQRELFGFDRTREISIKPAQEIAEAAKAWGQNDDITVVTVRRNA